MEIVHSIRKFIRLVGKRYVYQLLKGVWELGDWKTWLPLFHTNFGGGLESNLLYGLNFYRPNIAKVFSPVPKHHLCMTVFNGDGCAKLDPLCKITLFGQWELARSVFGLIIGLVNKLYVILCIGELWAFIVWTSFGKISSGMCRS